MNDLIVIGQAEIGEAQVNAVNARDLHAFLGVKTQFKDWIVRRIEDFGFGEDLDFCSFLSESTGGRPTKEYHLSLDMAKELSMVERNEKGKQARLYFIDCERRAKQVVALPDFTRPAIAARAWAEQFEGRAIAEQTAAVQARQIEEQKPLVDFAEKVSRSNDSINLGDFAKVISGKSSYIIGRNSLFELLRAWAILDRRNQPYQHYIELGWFTVREGVYENEKTNGPRVCFTTMITGKGQVALHKKVEEYFEAKSLEVSNA